jgi:hypothetical protein
MARLSFDADIVPAGPRHEAPDEGAPLPPRQAGSRWRRRFDGRWTHLRQKRAKTAASNRLHSLAQKRTRDLDHEHFLAGALAGALARAEAKWRRLADADDRRMQREERAKEQARRMAASKERLHRVCGLSFNLNLKERRAAHAASKRRLIADLARQRALREQRTRRRRKLRFFAAALLLRRRNPEALAGDAAASGEARRGERPGKGPATAMLGPRKPSARAQGTTV